jgi:8-oxo-dGTP pyrophosphatase MutT (NUDIX family)
VFLSDSTCEKVAVGAAVYRSIGSPATTHVLIVQRADEKKEKDYPNSFELPGGSVLRSVNVEIMLRNYFSHVDEEDESILHAVARELFEETGLTVTEIVGEFPGFSYNGNKTIQLNFAVKVEKSSEVKLNSLEH